MVTHMTCFFFAVCNLVPGVTLGVRQKTNRDNIESTRDQDCSKGVSEGESHGVIISCENRIDTDILSLLV